MSKQELGSLLTITNQSRKSRAESAHLVLSQPDLFDELFEHIKRVKEPYSIKAWWVTEYILRKDLTLLLPYLKEFIPLLKRIHFDGALRSGSVIVELISIDYYCTDGSLSRKHLHQSQRIMLTEIAFEWLITPQKVAVEAHAMAILYWLGTEFEWIHPALKELILKNYKQKSPAYKARGRHILKAIESFKWKQ